MTLAPNHMAVSIVPNPNRPTCPHRLLLLLFAAHLLPTGTALSAADLQPGTFQAGPLYADFSLTLEPGKRLEALGPFLYRQHGESTRQWGAPPFLSYTVDDGVDSAEFDLLYPLLTYDRYGGDYRLQLLQWLNFSGGPSLTGTNVSRFTLFPFYFQQRSDLPERNYTAIFPIYGRMQNRLFRSQIFFVAWPAYVRTSKGEVVTDNVLYPFFHLRHGGGVSGWQFWPVVGREEKPVSSKTNQWNDAEVVAGHRKFFALWPFYFNQSTGLGTTNAMHQNALLPLYSVQKSEWRRSVTAPWPLGFSHTVDDRLHYREWAAPWPLVVFARGPGKRVSRVLPLFSRARSDLISQNSWLWPVYQHRRVTSAPLDRDRTRLLFFLYTDVNERNTETGTSRHRNALWPLYTHRREADGSRRLQILAPLEPIVPGNKSIERNLSPLWSLWRQEWNGDTGASSQSLLWNLYRRDTTADTKKGSILFGLIQYQSGPDGRRWRLFHWPRGTSGPGTARRADEP